MKRLPILTSLALASVLASSAAAQMPVPPGVDQGRGVGMWCAPTPTANGMVDGMLYASDGTERYFLKGEVVAPGFQRVGALHGVLAPVLQAGTDPYPMYRMFVMGSWLAPDGEHGQFNGMILMTFRGVPLPAILGQLEGSFDLTPPAALDLTGRRRHRVASMFVPYLRRTPNEGATMGPSFSMTAVAHGGARLAGPDPTSIVIVCPKGPDFLRHAGADLAEPISAGRKLASVLGRVAVAGVEPHNGARQVSPVPVPPAVKLVGVEPAGPHAPIGPVPADAIRRGPFVLRWFLDS